MAEVVKIIENPLETLEHIFSDSESLGEETNSHKEEYKVHTPVFDGPLDLLLHLLRKEELNIYDIPIAKICTSYTNQLRAMLSPDVNVASEFFVMAATLTHIKSQMLLPKENQDEEDPRKPLVAKLLEYEQFKKASIQLDSRAWLGRDLFSRTEVSVDDIMPDETKLDAPIEAVDNFQLLLCLKIALDRTFRKPIEISADMTSIKEKVTYISGLLESQTNLSFADLMSPSPRLNEVIVSFLAILELAKLKFIEIIQIENFGVIQIRPVRELREINYGLLDQY